MGSTALRMARLFGFRRDAHRDAYVLRLVGNWVGPVLRADDASDAAATAMGWSPEPHPERRTRDRRQATRPVARERRSGRDRRSPLAA